MSSTYAECSLFLSPVDSAFRIDEPEAFLYALKQTGFISGTIDDQTDDDPTDEKQADIFYTGERFLEHIAYMGCSPAVQFETSDESDSFCHIRLHHYNEAVLIVSRKQSRPPQCPRCNKPVRSFDVSKQGEKTTPEQISCESCHEASQPDEFNWRKLGGCARTFIEVTDIFPKEAIPQQSLLDRLAAITQTDWHYFYSCR